MWQCKENEVNAFATSFIFDNYISTYHSLHVCSRQALLCARLAACHVPLVLIMKGVYGDSGILEGYIFVLQRVATSLILQALLSHYNCSQFSWLLLLCHIVFTYTFLDTSFRYCPQSLFLYCSISNLESEKKICTGDHVYTELNIILGA